MKEEREWKAALLSSIAAALKETIPCLSGHKSHRCVHNICLFNFKVNVWFIVLANSMRFDSSRKSVALDTNSLYEYILQAGEVMVIEKSIKN